MSWWVADLIETNRVLLVSWVIWIIFSITLHELGHGWAAIRQGDDTPIVTGHMTWNPIVHMGPMSFIALAVVGIAWGAMPVNPARFKDRYGDAIVSLAGPAMNLGLAVVCIIAATVWEALGGGYWSDHVAIADPMYTNVLTFVHTGAMLNIVLLLFNLLPFPPLDGSRIAASLSPAYRRLANHPDAAVVLLIGFVAMFMWGGQYLFEAAGTTVDYAVRTLLAVIAPA